MTMTAERAIGFIVHPETEQCAVCKGQGIVRSTLFPVPSTCGYCRGSGRVPRLQVTHVGRPSVAVQPHQPSAEVAELVKVLRDLDAHLMGNLLLPLELQGRVSEILGKWKDVPP